MATPSLLVVMFMPSGHRDTQALAEAWARLVEQWSAEDEDLTIDVVATGRVYDAWHGVADRVRATQPDWCVLFDVDRESDEYKLHVFAANLDDDEEPDAEGTVRRDTIIDQQGPVAFRTKLPQDGIWDKFIVERVPVRMSHKAGGHVFNHMLYRLLQVVHAESLPVRVGAVETPPIGPPDAAAPTRAPEAATGELRMICSVLRQLRGAVPTPTEG